MSLKGSCLCEAVAYEIDGLDSPIKHCHCRTCRKAQGAAFNSAAQVKREHFRWLSGEDKLAAYESSPGKLRRFCSVCGSPILSEYPDRPFVVLRVATLDEDPGLKAEQHIWLSHAAPWLEESEAMERYEEWPPTH